MSQPSAISPDAKDCLVSSTKRNEARQPLSAEANTRGKFRHLGCAMNSTSRFPVVAAHRLRTNQAGFGVMDHCPVASERDKGRKGPVTTVFSVWSINSAL